MCALYSRKNDRTRSGRPVLRCRGDREVGRQRRRLERAGRVAVGDRDAAVDLGHHDDLDRVVVDRDEVAAPGRTRSSAPSRRSHRPTMVVVVDVALGREPVEHPAHPPVGVAVVEPGRRLGDVLLDPREVGLGAGQHRVGVGRGVQGERELAGELLGAQPGVAVGRRRARDRSQSRCSSSAATARVPGRLDLAAQRRLLAERALELGGEQRAGAGELPDRRLDVHPGHRRRAPRGRSSSRAGTAASRPAAERSRSPSGAKSRASNV